jgi:uncharacterized protein with HEPN domain
LRGCLSLGAQAEVLIPTQPWGEIRGMGNQLRHSYDRVSLSVIWDTVSYRLPSLEADVRQALAGLGPEGTSAG